MVYGTTRTFTGEGSFCPREFAESVSGYTVDLAVNAYGKVISYDGMDREAWVVENCYKYGYVVRYPSGKEAVTGENYCPWHLRYVGALNAAVMHKNDLCIEEYFDFAKDYTFESPYKFSLDGTTYDIYGAKVSSDGTSVRVPIKGDHKISGNNIDSFVIYAEELDIE